MPSVVGLARGPQTSWHLHFFAVSTNDVAIVILHPLCFDGRKMLCRVLAGTVAKDQSTVALQIQLENLPSVAQLALQIVEVVKEGFSGPYVGTMMKCPHIQPLSQLLIMSNSPWKKAGCQKLECIHPLTTTIYIYICIRL